MAKNGMTDNIKKTDSLKIAIIINIIIIILILFLFDVESLGEGRLILFPLFGISSISLITLSIYFLVKSMGKIIKWEKQEIKRDKLEIWENFEAWENPKMWENITAWKKFTVWDIIFIVFILLFIILPLIFRRYSDEYSNFLFVVLCIFFAILLILSVYFFVKSMGKIIKGEKLTTRDILFTILLLLFLILLL